MVLTLPMGNIGPLTMSADQPWVITSLAPAASTSSRHLLIITLRKDAPLGDIQANVTINANGKAALKIPVVAELTN